MKNITLMTEEYRFPAVCQVINMPNTITASLCRPIGMSLAERFVITFMPHAKSSYVVYRELLKWNQDTWMWYHGSYAEPAYRSTYLGAFNNLDNRFRSTIK